MGIEEAQASVTEAEQRVEQLEQELEKLEAEKQEINRRLDALEAMEAITQEDLLTKENCQRLLRKLDGHTSEIEEKLANANEDLGAASHEVDRLQYMVLTKQIEEESAAFDEYAQELELTLRSRLEEHKKLIAKANGISHRLPQVKIGSLFSLLHPDRLFASLGKGLENQRDERERRASQAEIARKQREAYGQPLIPAHAGRWVGAPRGEVRIVGFDEGRMNQPDNQAIIDVGGFND